MPKPKIAFLAILGIVIFPLFNHVHSFDFIEVERELYKMQIKQKTPTAGIQTGHVIAYGHYIRRPYVILLNDTVVCVNNVQVHPALETEGAKEQRLKNAEIAAAQKQIEAEVKTAVEKDKNLMQLFEQARKSYEQELAKGKTLKESFHAASFKFLSSPAVDSVFVGRNFMSVYFTSMETHYLITRDDFEPWLKKSQAQLDSIRLWEEGELQKALEHLYIKAAEEGYPATEYGLKQKGANDKAQFLSEWLKKGKGYVVETNGIQTLPEETIVFIIRVLRDNHLSKTEKAYLLRSKWYMHNYDPAEWPTLDEIEEKWVNGKAYIARADSLVPLMLKQARELFLEGSDESWQ